MTFEIGFVLALIAGTVALFATEKLRVDLVAVLVMGVLIVSGIVTPEEGLSGFSNAATLTVGAMFILSAGLSRTGAVAIVGALLGRAARRSRWVGTALVMATAGLVSAFVNNTAAVAVFLPIVLGVARETQTSPSKLLMPLSFASMLGGTCTLLGTSTNILVSSIAERQGQPAFRMFEFAPLGLVFFAAGSAYLLAVGIRLIPERRSAEGLTGAYGMKDYLSEIELLPEAKSVGKTLGGSPLVKELEIDVLEIVRDGLRMAFPPPYTVLRAGDALRVRCDVEKMKTLQEREGIRIRSDVSLRDKDLTTDDTVLVEAVIAPYSGLAGRTLREARPGGYQGATVLALRHRDELRHGNLAQAVLRPGDALLLDVQKDRLDQLRADDDYVLVSELDLPWLRKRRIPLALGIIAAVVAVAALGILPIVASAALGSILMVLTRCLTMEEAYDAIEWKVIFLLAGVLALGVGLEKSGAAQLLAKFMVGTAGAWGPVALVATFYLVTSLLTEAMSNNATAALLAPIAIATASALGIDARPLLMAVTFAASASFMTPVGYQTNTLIYGPGQYRFSDFIRVGAPLNLVLWILATALIPVFWPF